MRALIAILIAVAAMPCLAAEVSVTDGDTLILDGVIYRLESIEAPQTDQTCLDDKGAVWRCGVEARDRLRDYIGKRDIRCDDRGADRNYRKRRIGICQVAGESTSVNQWLVREGWALGGRGAKQPFKDDQAHATSNRVGLWKGCFVSPEVLRRFTISTAALLGAACPKENDWRVRQTLFPDEPAMPAGCAIKGRIGLRSQIAGYRGIYHLESCRSHARVKNPHRWFCSEDEARAEGFRKSYTC